MQSKTYLYIVGVFLILLAGYFLFKGRVGYQKSIPQPSNQSTNKDTKFQTSTPTQSQISPSNGAASGKTFTIVANDSSASPTSIRIKKGEAVEITFQVKKEGTYYGGLDFRSPIVSSGKIAPGESKTISFKADQSFSFTPYWPASNVAKPYKIEVIVE